MEINWRTDVDKYTFAITYLQGEGIEIGGLHCPLNVSKEAHVSLVDKISVKEMREHYPELAKYSISEPHILDDGETLTKFKDASLDFVISSHFVEHCKNPILHLKNAYRVLKEQGFYLLVVPDKRYTFDADQQLTSFEHLWSDFEKGSSGEEHLEIWADKYHFDKKLQWINWAIKVGYSIHYHNWTCETFDSFLQEIIKRKVINFKILERSANGNEFSYVLKKISEFI